MDDSDFYSDLSVVARDGVNIPSPENLIAQQLTLTVRD